ncbi:hypothetical protein ACFYS8_30430 [Kitasatospora sp. NPDC004615]|uniref:hypothetical protein n=1 Tax=unclassified Kitasatospora TaxID=2633591 RepID=UPI0036BCE138
MAQLSVPIVCGLSGDLAIPALQVVALLRALPEEWQDWAQRDDNELDPVTAAVFASLVRQLADQIDLACIEITSEG